MPTSATRRRPRKDGRQRSTGVAIRTTAARIASAVSRKSAGCLASGPRGGQCIDRRRQHRRGRQPEGPGPSARGPPRRGRGRRAWRRRAPAPTSQASGGRAPGRRAAAPSARARRGPARLTTRRWLCRAPRSDSGLTVASASTLAVGGAHEERERPGARPGALAPGPERDRADRRVDGERVRRRVDDRRLFGEHPFGGDQAQAGRLRAGRRGYRLRPDEPKPQRARGDEHRWRDGEPVRWRAVGRRPATRQGRPTTRPAVPPRREACRRGRRP